MTEIRKVCSSNAMELIGNKKKRKKSGKFTEELKVNNISLNNQQIKKTRKYFEVIENKYETC